MQALSLENIHFGYKSGDEPALDIGRLEIGSGERVALIGPSGAGKSTLLKLIDGRLRNWSGKAVVLGETISSRRTPGRTFSRKIGFVFQEFALIERQTVFENVRNGRLGHLSTARSVFGRLTPEDYKQILTAIEETGLQELMHRRADELSGGQRQRVAIARCLAQQPGMILADEPISNLDPVRAREILDLLVKVCELRQATLIITTHQPMLVRTYVDRIIALSEGSVILDEESSPASAAQVMAVYEEMADPLAAHNKPASV
ncbi:phosphonate ABC transporter ATP-binding protein [Hoeflea sp. TYP-13]|uniref:phosphonate ABC transporter ATP-binding protein n=1 Tax=Hoeflea sp. TYP-13 TaxID=3230023 RepID=UPI0034C5C35A